MAKKRRKGLGNPMVAMAAADAAKNMTPNQKMWLIGGSIVAVGALAFVGYKVYKSITGTKADDVKNEMSANLRDMTISKSDLTISADKAIMMAQNIFDAMNQKGTDYKTIKDQLDSLKTQADLLYVIHSFNVHNYGTWGEADGWFAKKIGYATPLNMTGWFKKELDSKQSQEVQAIYKKFNVPY